jgi:hypothetical protein
MSGPHPKERVVVAHTAGTAAEAMVIRGLLQSVGIRSPKSGSSDLFPFALPGAAEGVHSIEVWVLESQADEARRIIEEYLKGSASTNMPVE